MTLPVLTNSRMKAYRLCPEYHFRTYVQGWKPIGQSGPLAFGSAFHALMENYWAGSDKEPGLDDPFEAARLDALFDGYLARWSTEDEQYETVSVEEKFDVPLVHPITGAEHSRFRLAGKVDLKVTRAGKRILGEHKTSGEDISLGSMYWRRLDLDTQILLYWHAQQTLGWAPDEILYDVAAKPKNRPKKTETPDEFYKRIMGDIAESPAEYYARGTLTRTQEQIDAAVIDAWDYADRIARDIDEGWHARNVDGCFKYGRPCAFFDACSYRAEPDPMKFIRSDVINPELSEDNKEAA